jgi:hypothetical protein
LRLRLEPHDAHAFRVCDAVGDCCAARDLPNRFCRFVSCQPTRIVPPTHASNNSQIENLVHVDALKSDDPSCGSETAPCGSLSYVEPHFRAPTDKLPLASIYCLFILGRVDTSLNQFSPSDTFFCDTQPVL